MLERLLSEDIAQQVKDVFDQTLQNPVHILFFGSELRCEYCQPTRSLLEEIIPLSDKLSLKIHDVENEPEIAKKYHVDKTPGIVITAKEKKEIIDFGIRYSGMPSGHEFTSLINDIIMVSRRSTDLNQETRAFLGTINKDVLLQVFVTPTCPYCPPAVNLAHAMAFETPYIQAEMIEAMEFPDLANQFHVSGVPQTTINNGSGTMVGSGPEEELINEIKRVLAK